MVHIDARYADRLFEVRALYSGAGNLTVKGITILKEN